MRYSESLRLYKIVLSEDDFDFICSGFPESGFLVGMHEPTRTRFEIHDSSEISGSWQAIPDGGYVLHFGGVEVPIPPVGVSSEEFDCLADRFYENTRTALNGLGRLPMVMDYGGSLGRRIIGHIEMSVAEK